VRVFICALQSREINEKKMKKIREIGRPDGSIRYFAREGALLRNRRFAPLDVRG